MGTPDLQVLNGTARPVWDTSARSVRSGAWTSARGVCGDDTLLGLTGGRLLALAGDRVRVWDTTSGRELATVAHPGALGAVVSADGSFLATGGGQKIRVWRLPNRGAPVFRHSLDNESLTGLAWDSSRPLLRYLEGGTVHTLDLTTTLTRAWRTSETQALRSSGRHGPSTPADEQMKGRRGAQPIRHRTCAEPSVRPISA